MADTPHTVTFNIMLRAPGGIDFKRAGAAVLATVPVQGGVLDVMLDGRAIRGIVDALFIPPGCEENCIGTVFLSEG
jgi:hypothetical protein